MSDTAPSVPPSVPEIAARLLARDPSPLVPQAVCDAALAPAIRALDAPDSVKTALHLLNDDLASAHPAAQAAEGTASGDWAHAIIHRREGDYGNARYWLGRAADAPALAAFHGPAGPAEFLEQCRRTGRGRDAALERRQRDEIVALLAHAQAAGD